MPYFQAKNIRIAAIAAAVPQETVKVSDFGARFGEEYCQKFSDSTGIREFRRTSPYQTASDLCYTAARQIINNKGIDPASIGALVFVAHSTDYRRPATACVLHHRLGLSKDCAAFDISLGCSAFVYGLQVVGAMMQSSNIDRALLLVGETLTKMTHPEDRSVAMLFGDGGGAVLLERSDDDEGIEGMLKSDGSGYRAIIAPAGGFRNMDAPHDIVQMPDGSRRTLYNTWMNGTDVYAFTISDVPRTIKEFLARTGREIDSYDCLAFHQANRYIHQQLAKKLKAAPARMPLCLDRYGNTSAAAIPLVLCDHYGTDYDEQRLSMLMCGFGVGLSWGVCSAKVAPCDILPVIETNDYYAEGIMSATDLQ